MLRGIFVAIVFLSLLNTCATEIVVLKSGKRMEGKVISEDSQTVVFRDTGGISFSFKKTQLDLVATRLANQVQPQTNVEARLQAKPRIYTNRDIAPASTQEEAPGRDLEDWNRKIQKAEADYRRLASECRAAGTGSKGERKTAIYIVEGKAISVTGYYADTREIQRAKEICAKALEKQSFLQRARHYLEKLLENE